MESTESSQKALEDNSKRIQDIDNQQRIGADKLKRFVRHLSIIAKKHKEREDARARLDEQLRKLRRFSFKKKEMDEELEDIHSQVSTVLEKERQLLGFEVGESAASRELVRKTMENREKIRQMNDSIKALKEKIEEYINIKTARDRKIRELERKIKGKIGQKKEVGALKNKLRKLEQMYIRLKKKGVDVGRIESRIEDLKLRLSFS